MITKPVWMLQYQERDVCTMIRAIVIALDLQAVCFLIKLQVLSEQGKKNNLCCLFEAGRVMNKNTPLLFSNSGTHLISHYFPPFTLLQEHGLYASVDSCRTVL